MTSRNSTLLAILVALPLGACIHVQNNNGGDGTKEPDTATDGSGTDGSSNPARASRARDSSSTKGVKGKMLGTKLEPSAPPVDPTDKPSRGAAVKGGKLAVGEFLPNTGAPGTQVEIMGSGFGTDASKIAVTTGGTAWEVVSVHADRLVAKVGAGAASGPIVVKLGSKSATTSGSFSVTSADGGFGDPSVDDHGLLGEVFPLSSGASALPDFGSLGAPAATIAVSMLDIPTRSFTEGFPGVSGGLVEWFAIRFTGVLNVTQGAEYTLCLNSDDGSKLYLEDTLVVDNDGTHSTTEKCEVAYLEPGGYRLRVEYFQGPATEIALQLKWGADGATPAPIPSTNLLRGVR